MIEYAVKNQPHASLLCLVDKRRKSRVAAQRGVNFEEVVSVVSVIRTSFEDGVQVKRVNTKTLQVVELGSYAGEIATVKLRPILVLKLPRLTRIAYRNVPRRAR